MQKARYDLFVRALAFGFLHKSLFEANHAAVIMRPLIQYGGLEFTRVNYIMYQPLPDAQFCIRVLIGFGYIFYRDELFYRVY